MISSLRGRVLVAAGSTLVIDVGGVGFQVNTTPALVLASRVGDELSVHTVLIVREDSLTVFGFGTRDELEVFELLVGVNGVGPKSALGVLSVLSPDEVAAAVHREDDAAFRKVSGIGPKTAKLIVVSLTGKLAAPAARATSAPVASGSIGDSVLAALTGLGWSEKVAAEALDETILAVSEADAASVPTLLRLTLARLGPAQQGGRAR
ncbi:Holliday junction branch migration protein RuvA [Agromyces soli]|uniref:Holliday junction branch migration complex subunit RuvA n=1 Tax=Agromyces soli TaxID=659012 RepID=A0ABY4AQE1_9MICO|nr:Holliday junction branch migration protein RuvA [Agromyces soli]UOE25328.1 Holliday junction branch migration protein RuvA [Agromyces soli]